MQTDHQIIVEQQSEGEDKFIFSVSVKEDNISEHTVTVEKDYYQKLTNGDESLKNLVKRSFNFLLQRESQSAILPEFNLKVINNYFPSFEDEIKL